MQSVLWTKGLLLTPQHLQSQDRFFEDVLNYQLSVLTAHPWGFSRLEINREALAGGMLSVAGAEGILQDGSAFSVPSSDRPPAPLNLEQVWKLEQESMDVVLAVPEYRAGQMNISVDPDDRHSRFLAEAVVQVDENTGKSSEEIQLARKNFRLAMEGESLDGMVTLRIARMFRTPAGEYRLDPKFIPPLVNIQASAHLMAILRRLVEILSARSEILSGSRRERGKDLADFGVSDVANFWLLYTVNSHLPILRHYFNTETCHPLQLFSAMSSLAASLVTFSPSIHPRDLPSYDHSDLSGCFTVLDEMLRELLETVIPKGFVSLSLSEVDQRVYAVALDHDEYFTAPRLFVAVRSEMETGRLLKSFPQLAKITSGSRVDRLIRKALPGLKLTYVPDPPGSIPVKLDHHYFEIQREGKEWEGVQEDRNLAAYVPSEFGDPSLELVILLPAGEAG